MGYTQHNTIADAMRSEGTAQGGVLNTRRKLVNYEPIF
jgi:hypothetical protein